MESLIFHIQKTNNVFSLSPFFKKYDILLMIIPSVY